MATSINIKQQSIIFSDNSSQSSSGVSVGTILMYAGTTINDISGNFVLCNGDVLDANTNSKYNDLYTVIGTKYGGTGKSNFNVPKFTERIPKHSNSIAYGGTNSINYLHLPHTHAINGLGLRNNYNNHSYDGVNKNTRELTNGFNAAYSYVTTSNTLDDSNNPLNSIGDKYYPPYCAINYIICYKQ